MLHAGLSPCKLGTQGGPLKRLKAATERAEQADAYVRSPLLNALCCLDRMIATDKQK